MTPSFNPLDFPLISRIRRNHALEHATMHVLSEKKPSRTLAGYSDLGGFWIVGKVTTEELRDAVDEAMARLHSGEYALAIQPNCGTNFAAAGLLAGSAAWLAMLNIGPGFRRKLDRWPLVVTLVTLVLILAQPLGLILQARATTQAQLKGLQVTGILLHSRRDLVVQRVLTRH